MSFELTEGKYIALLRRIKALEEMVNNLVVALDKCTTQQQLQELLVVVQTDIKDCQEQLIALDNRVTDIEEEPLS